jgi:hypothetical protein
MLFKLWRQGRVNSDLEPLLQMDHDISNVFSPVNCGVLSIAKTSNSLDNPVTVASP